MRINNNIAAYNSYRNLTSTGVNLGKSLEKLSSGYRINRAADDAAGLVISQKLRAEITGLKTAVRNVQDGISVVQTAEGALTEVHGMLTRMRELAVQASNAGANDSTAVAAAQAEVDALVSEIDHISQKTEFAGIKLLDGTFGVAAGGSNGQFQVSAAAGDTVTVDIAGTDSVTLTVDTVITGGASDLATSPSGAITAIDAAIQTVSQTRGALGATQNRFESMINNLQVAVENLTASESRIRDADMAQEMITFTKNQILQQAGTAMLAQANQVPQSILKLLQ
jgi:flagellin